VFSAFRCARRSLACLVDESSTMLIAHSTCSNPSGGLGNESRRSLGEQTCEPQRQRIRFGLVTHLSTASLPKVVKPVILLEAMSTRSEGVDRGGWEQRARKDTPRNLGDPSGWDFPNGLCEGISKVHPVRK